MKETKGKIVIAIILTVVMLIASVKSSMAYADNLNMDEDRVIIMPSFIWNGTGTITISSSVKDYKLYYQSVDMSDEQYETCVNLKEKYKLEDLENELDEAEKKYNNATTPEDKKTYGEKYNDLVEKYNSKITEYKYNLQAILTDLVYARILSPSSKLASYDYCQTLLEPPKYSLQDVYRSLSVIAEESDFIQSELYKNSNFLYPRNNRILYYDCTNYYFEIEEESDSKRYGKSKENRPNPIVTMGLFMDADGIPLAFDVYPGNQNEQTTLKPLESKILQDFNCSEFIYCSDSGLGSAANRRFNSLGNRAYIITHSLKKMKKEDREIALNPTQFRKVGSTKFIDLRTLDETDEEVYNTVYYKEVPVVTGNMDETLIVTYSPKYKAYQRRIRDRQIEHAEKIINTPGRKRKGKNQNDPMRFVKKTSVTPDGEIANKQVYNIDEEQIQKEEMYDGFYAVITNLEGDVSEIIRINKQRWEIEENFRIMKTEFEARPVYVRREERIKAHFMTCYISLLLYRLLEKKLGDAYTVSQILGTLRSMQMTLLNTASGYIPSYTRTELTDSLHKTFGFRTDYEFITKASMRTIIKETKQIKSKKS
mgnify:CR=1 FL=1